MQMVLLFTRRHSRLISKQIGYHAKCESCQRSLFRLPGNLLKRHRHGVGLEDCSSSGVIELLYVGTV